MKLVGILYCLGLSALTVGCGAGERHQDLSDTSYRVTGPSSAGLTWKVHNEVIRICYQDPSNSDRHREDVVYSVLEWVNGLAGVATEPLATEVELVGPQDACDAKVIVGNYSPARTRLGSKPEVMINYSGWFGSKTVTLHEFGHAFGLLDTYNGSGGSCQSGQPDSVMCRASYDKLKPDDIAGMAAIYRKVRDAHGSMTIDEYEGQVVY